MSAYAKRAAIALGYNNLAGLTQVHRLNSLYFQNYKTWINMEYTPYEAIELSGARKYKRFGLPSCVWIFEALTADELQFFLSTFLTNSFDSEEVTIRSFTNESNQWYNYNAILQRYVPDNSNWNGYEYRDVRIQFYDLEIIP